MASILATKAFWSSAIERAVKTFAQSFLALITAAATNILTLDWQQGVTIAGVAALASVLTSIASVSPTVTLPPAEDPKTKE